MSRETNDKRYVLSRLNECKNTDEAVALIRSLVEGPKFFALFRNFADAKRAAAKIPYIDKQGTVTYIKSTDEGYQLFTGGIISDKDAAQVFSVVNDPKSRQIALSFYDWAPQV
ncbi:MAG: hypothetical protein NWF05_02050 [Candidatus Bathyarchaeota archaeon]|nr:hypothetical protein [Candidatus Bathyarchaeota archaeon]